MTLNVSRYMVVSMCVDSKPGKRTEIYIRVDRFAAPRFARDFYNYAMKHPSAATVFGKKENVFLLRDGTKALTVTFAVGLAQAQFSKDGTLELDGGVD